MTREEAAEFTRKLVARAEINAFPKTPKTINNIPVFYFEAVLSALCGPQPDPITGLMPCGCGGKAQTINSSGYSRRLYVECDRCAIMLGIEATGDGALQGIYRYDDQIIKDWNRAMGWRVEG